MRLSAIGPVLNEVQFIGYSIMAALDQMHEFVYALDARSNDGTRELLYHIKGKYAHEKLVILDWPNFHPSDMKAYNDAFQGCIAQMTGEAAMFLHPDQIITNPEAIKTMPADALAWWVTMHSYARDFNTVITKGRCTQWKNIHAKKFGLAYLGGYGSANEDFYHRQITGNSLKHYGTEFSNYPFLVKDSGLVVNHYCELKPYSRRLEKMKLCLTTQFPGAVPLRIDEMAYTHPRVTLEQSCNQFGEFQFTETKNAVPSVFEKYKDEFESFSKELISNG